MCSPRTRPLHLSPSRSPIAVPRARPDYAPTPLASPIASGLVLNPVHIGERKFQRQAPSWVTLYPSLGSEPTPLLGFQDPAYSTPTANPDRDTLFPRPRPPQATPTPLSKVEFPAHTALGDPNPSLGVWPTSTLALQRPAASLGLRGPAYSTPFTNSWLGLRHYAQATPSCDHTH